MNRQVGGNSAFMNQLDNADWRRVLAGYALAVYQGGQVDTHSGDGGCALQEFHTQLTELLGPLCEEAMQIVEAFAIGAKSQLVQSKGETSHPDFDARLAIILNGLAPSVKVAKVSNGGDTQVIQSDLWQLLRKVRESAELSYAREMDLVELDRRILLLLCDIGPLAPAEISSTAGVDKAQVSRSVKRLLEVKMVERDQIRSPVTLTRKGSTLANRLMRLAELRNRELTFDIGDQELAKFFAVIEQLLQRAVTLYEQERVRGQEVSTSANPLQADPEDMPGKPILIERTRIISPLMTLSAYFSRSGSLTFKRLTGLSNFETWVLNEIGRDSPLEWNSLVKRLDRDHSQAGRTVRALEEQGLIERSGRPGRRHGRFSPTEEGLKIFHVVTEASRQRSAFLMAPLSEEERTGFLGTFGKVRRNAAVQLEREKTYDELNHS